MNMQLQILVNSEMWILTFPAQASASTENKPAHYLWRDNQIQLPNSLRSSNNKHAGHHLHILVPLLLTIVLDWGKTHMYLDETRIEKTFTKQFKTLKMTIKT